MEKKINVAGVGCCLVDYLFNNISFNSESFLKYRSKKTGDGGLIPGKLVFAEEFETYSNQPLDSSLAEITKGSQGGKRNIGGPGIVALIHAAQMLEGSNCRLSFFGARGNDEAGNYLQNELAKFPVNTECYKALDGPTPSTFVLSDPQYHSGTGERVFINAIGAAGNYLPQYLDTKFFASDVVVFGGTALVPEIHDNLAELLNKAKTNGCITIVNTVYDFRNQKRNPHKKWPLGNSDNSYAAIDLLITNREEALRLSGRESVQDALAFFNQLGTGAAVVTNGADPVCMYAGKNSIFHEIETAELPVSAQITEELSHQAKGDTTGCGDNFAGGVIGSIVMQLQKNARKLNLKEAASWGVVSGGFSCFYLGGTYHQKNSGEKQELIRKYYKAYSVQTGNE